MTSDDGEWVPLLSVKPLGEFTPEAFREYVRGLHQERKRKVRAPTKKKPLKVRVTRLKKGGLSIVTKREPKYMTPEEYSVFAREFPENELFIALKGREMSVMSHEEAEAVKLELKDFPW